MKLKDYNIMSTQLLEQLLATTGATVTFTKADGTERVLRGTRNFANIPANMYPKQESMPGIVNEDTVRVFDLDINAWRSFRKDSVKSYE